MIFECCGNVTSTYVKHLQLTTEEFVKYSLLYADFISEPEAVPMNCSKRKD